MVPMIRWFRALLGDVAPVASDREAGPNDREAGPLADREAVRTVEAAFGAFL